MQGDVAQAQLGWDVRDDIHLTVQAKEQVADGVVLLRLANEDMLVPRWQPGAHIDLILDNGFVRQYSLCGAPEDRNGLTVAVLNEPQSRGGSRYIHDSLKPGDAVGICGPRNNFALAPADSYLFVAGGIGITPLLPMIREIDAAGKPWRLVYGGRTRTSMAFVDELVERAPDKVEVHPEEEFGLLDLGDAVDRTETGTAIYCCGPEPLLTAMEDLCSANDRVSLHVERFTPKEQADDALDGSFEVELARSGKVIQVESGLSLLEALEQEGVDIDFSCREGICGTCETTVCDGKPEHRDSLLTADERAANDVMFPCVSRCLSRRLVLDR